MRSKIVLFLLFTVNIVVAQNNYISIDQAIATDLAKKYEIKKVYAIENDTNCVLSKDCPISSLEEYDRQGRITSKESIWFYSDKPTEKRVFRYDSLDRIIRQKYYIKDSLVNIDYFDYDKKNRLVTWLVYFSNGEKSISKKIKYEGDRYVGEGLYANDTLRIQDSIYIEKDRTGRVTLEMHLKAGQVDSLIYQYDRGDTALTELRFVDRKLHSMIQTIHVKQGLLMRRIIVEDGRAMGIEKQFYAENGDLTEQSLVHHFSESNYKKKFFYDKGGVLIRKEIYRNSRKPEAVIYFVFKYY